MYKKACRKVPAIAVMAALFLTVFPVAALAEEVPVNKEIHVFIEEQVLIAFEDGVEIYNFDIVYC